MRNGVVQGNTLYYLTSGFAFSNAKASIDTGVGTWTARFQYGGVIGIGMEQPIANNPNWTWRAEALYLLYLRQSMDGGVSGYDVRLQNSDLIVRFGVSVKN
jgi:hypothetical protein